MSHSLSGEEQERKLFVGGFNKLTTDEDVVKSYFEQHYGNVIDCTILRDNEKVSRGFGFILFDDAETVDKIMRAKKNGERFSLDGETNMEVKRALPRGDKEGRAPDRVRDNKVFVGGLPSSITEEELRQYFEAYGHVTQIELLRDRETGRLRGFAFVAFEDEDSADKCIQRRTHEICRKMCEVKRSHPTKPRTERRPDNYENNRDSGGSSGVLKPPQQPLIQTGNTAGQDINTLIQQAFLMGQQSVYQQLGLQQPGTAAPTLNLGVGGLSGLTLPTQQPTNNILLQALANQQQAAPIIPAVAPPIVPQVAPVQPNANTDTLAQLAQLLQGGIDPSRLGALLKSEPTTQRTPASAPAPANGYPTSYPGVYSQASSNYGAVKSDDKRAYRPY